MPRLPAPHGDPPGLARPPIRVTAGKSPCICADGRAIHPDRLRRSPHRLCALSAGHGRSGLLVPGPFVPPERRSPGRLLELVAGSGQRPAVPPKESVVPEPITSTANPLVKRIRALGRAQAPAARGGLLRARGCSRSGRRSRPARRSRPWSWRRSCLSPRRARRMVAEQEARGVRVARVTASVFASALRSRRPVRPRRDRRGRGPPGWSDLPRRPDAPLRRPARGRQPRQPRHDHPHRRRGRRGRRHPARRDDRPLRPGGGEGEHGRALRRAGRPRRRPGRLLRLGSGRAASPSPPPRRARGDDHWAARYPRPLALLLGSEGDGLPPDLLARGDLQVRIPMAGTARSLNLAVAAGVLLYEARRPRAADPGDPGDGDRR